MTELIGSFLKTYTTDGDANPHIEQMHKLIAFREKAMEVLPEEMHGTFSALEMKNGIIVVSCNESKTAFKLKTLEGEILSAIANSGGEEIHGIRTMLSTWR